ncbi:unnamed protein product [Microthlaspi erraticum]|uniref:Uncharacterized protein n=1 Tax=Microthlaspi erraticum TaxID=1685480 RepID=A0A6D2HJ16_9BRAS|nr:unnamed protein product [Microthlaspi erraticum]
MLQLSPTKLDSTSNPNKKRHKDHKPDLARPQHRRSSPDPRDSHLILCHKPSLDIFTLNSSPQTTCTGATTPRQVCTYPNWGHYTQGLANRCLYWGHYTQISQPRLILRPLHSDESAREQSPKP